VFPFGGNTGFDGIDLCSEGLHQTPDVINPDSNLMNLLLLVSGVDGCHKS